MISPLRNEVIKSMMMYRDVIMPDNRGWKCLEVGIDGDERPSGNFKAFGNGNEWVTMDNVAHLMPDIVADLCDTGIEADRFDLIIVSQTLEHIYDFNKAINECYRILKDGGYLIIDCPFQYPFHGTSDYGDYWRISHQGLRKQLRSTGFEVISCNIYGDILTSALAKK